MATLSSYKILVQNEVDDTSSRAGSIIEQAIKDTYQEILRFTVRDIAGTTEEDVTSTASQRYIETVNTYQDIKNVMYKPSGGVYSKMQRITEEEYYDRYVNSNDSDPMYYYLNAGKIYFNVAPETAGTVKVNGVAVQSELTGSQVSVISDRHTQVVLLGSIGRFKAYEGLQDAREYFKLYRGPYFEQGKVGGALKVMMDELSTNQPRKTPKLFGRK